MLHFSATRIQSFIRMKPLVVKWHFKKLSAIRIQKCFRRFTCQTHYDSMSHQTRRLQATMRMWIYRRSFQQKIARLVQLQCFLRSRSAILNLDTKKSRHLLETRSTTMIQSWWLCHRTRRMYALMRNNIVVIQNTFRGCIASTRVAERRLAVLRLQHFARKSLRACRIQMLLLAGSKSSITETTSATQVQRVFRGYIVRREFLTLQLCSRTIQCAFRGYLARLDFRLDLLDISILQATIRGWLVRRQVNQVKFAALRLQRWYRHMLWKRRQQGALVRWREGRACTILQAQARQFLAVRFCACQRASRRIQAVWRGFNTNRHFHLCRSSSIVIQSFARQCADARIVAYRGASLCILQRNARMTLSRKRFVRTLLLLKRIQSTYRMHIGHKRYHRGRQSVVKIQALFRRYLVRASLELDNFAATEIQRCWRGYFEYSNYACKVVCAARIQGSVRQWLATREIAEKRHRRNLLVLRENAAANVIKRSYQCYRLNQLKQLSAVKIQNQVLRFLKSSSYARLRQGVMRLQGVVRARQLRKKSSSRLKKVARRLKALEQRASSNPDLRIGNRASAALRLLLHCKSLTEIMALMSILELSTRLSYDCCVAFNKARAPAILFTLVRTCNRSLPHLELLHCTLQTMSNVSTHSDLLPDVAAEPNVEVLLDLVQMFRDKNRIFALAVHLLSRLVRTKSELQTLCSSKENVKRLKGVLAMCSRKHHASNVRSTQNSDIHDSVRMLHKLIKFLER